MTSLIIRKISACMLDNPGATVVVSSFNQLPLCSQPLSFLVSLKTFQPCPDFLKQHSSCYRCFLPKWILARQLLSSSWTAEAQKLSICQPWSTRHRWTPWCIAMACSMIIFWPRSTSLETIMSASLLPPLHLWVCPQLLIYQHSQLWSQWTKFVDTLAWGPFKHCQHDLLYCLSCVHKIARHILNKACFFALLETYDTSVSLPKMNHSLPIVWSFQQNGLICYVFSPAWSHYSPPCPSLTRNCKGLNTLHLTGDLDMERRATDGGCLAEARVCEIAKQAAQGLYYLHSRGIVHLDIKPGNILSFHEGKIKLADFGTSAFHKGTCLGETPGTIPYMAAELFFVTSEDMAYYSYKVSVHSCTSCCIALTFVLLSYWLPSKICKLLFSNCMDLICWCSRVS